MIRSKTVDSLTQSLAEVSLRIQALTLPIDELESKSRVFEASLRTMEERQRVLRDVLLGEQRSLQAEVEGRIAGLRGQASAELVLLLDAGTSIELIEPRLAAAIERIFSGAQKNLVDEFSGQTDTVLASQQTRINAEINAVRRTAAEIFETPFRNFSEAGTFKLSHEPYWVTQETHTGLIPAVP